MNAIELIAALKGADEETAMELVDRLQCGEIDCSVLPTGKDNAVQQAQIWAQEARTQKGIVEEIGKLVGCANDWETVSAVKAALSGAQQGVSGGMIPVCEQLPEMGTPVIGFNPDWIDPDFNDRGLRECFTYGDADAPGGEWHTAKWVDSADQYETTDDKPTHWLPMVTAPQPAQVPEGWKLVPIEPTDEMVRKSNWSGNGDVSVNEDWARKTVWDRMIYAAPSPDHSGGVNEVADDLPGMWDQSDLSGGETDADHIADAGKVAFVDGLGAQRMTAEECKEGIEYIIHGDNIYWPLSDDDELRLIQAACGNGEFTYPQATPSVPENEIKALALEEYADQLDIVFARAQEAGAGNCPAWHAGQFAKDARKQAARLRQSSDGDDSEEETHG